LAKREERPQQRGHKVEVLATTTTGTKYYYVVGVGVGVGVVELTIMQHPSDCDGIAIFRISTKSPSTHTVGGFAGRRLPSTHS
jgi:hypothetical protein